MDLFSIELRKYGTPPTRGYKSATRAVRTDNSQFDHEYVMFWYCPDKYMYTRLHLNMYH